MNPLKRYALLLVPSLLFTAAYSTEARASGFYATERGVRPLGRGGAFVAGADDLGAIAYNPAGIFGAGSQFFIDGSLLIFGSEYTRQALLRQVDPNTGETVATYEQTFPTVEGSGALLPIPTLAGSFAPHPDWRVALGVFAPNAILPTYPEEVEGGPAPQRYQLITLDGSVLAVLGLYAAWRPIEQLQIGLGFELLLGSFTSRQVLSGCLPERFFCSPEDPEWDLQAEISAAPIVAPSGNLGLIWEFYKGWRVGASFHLPFYINAPATLHSRLPTAAPYRNAEQEGEDASLSFQLPWEIRLGVEMRDLVEGLRIEIAADYEHWAMHDKISVEPDDIAVTNLPGFPQKYYLPEIDIPRNLQSTIGAMIGAEYEIKVNDTIRVTPRLGFSYETSAVPSEYMSVLLLDAGKATPSVGLSLGIGSARFDLVYAHQFTPSVEVDPAKAQLAQVVPVAANTPENPDFVNGGIYSWHVDVIGLGFAYTFEPAAPYTSSSDPPKEQPKTEAPAEEPPKTEAPAAEPPKEEPPKTEPPKEEPKKEQPKKEQPKKTPPPKTAPKK
ncbi:MAG: outer membrane protein transport protein [Polyangiaceae bacterium]